MFLLHISSRFDPQHKTEMVLAALILLPPQTTEELLMRGIVILTLQFMFAVSRSPHKCNKRYLIKITL